MVARARSSHRNSTNSGKLGCPNTCVALVVFGLVLLISAPAPAAQPPDARQKIEELSSAMRGAAATTRRRVLDDFRRDLEGKIVNFTGTVWTLSSIDLDRGKADRMEIGPALFSWEFQGIQAKNNQPDTAPSSDTPNKQAQIRLGGADQATLIIVRSGKYQLYALTSAPAIVDGLRQGVPITVEVQITGLLEDSLFGFVTTVRAENTLPQCDQGHKLPDGHDFRFCPYCGEPLQ